MTPEELAEARRLSQEVVDAGQVPKLPMPMCSEQRVWELGHRIGLTMCACGQAGFEVRRFIAQSSDERVERAEIRHNYAVAPMIIFESDAVTVSNGLALGPGLHRSIEREHYVTHYFRDGELDGHYERYSTLGD